MALLQNEYSKPNVDVLIAVAQSQQYLIPSNESSCRESNNFFSRENP